MLNDLIRFSFRPPMIAFMIVSNVAVSFVPKGNLWYTPVAITVLVTTIVYTKRRYGFKKSA